MDQVRACEQVTDGRRRESHDLIYENIEIGTVIEHRPARTLTEADNIWMSQLSMNLHPLHIDNFHCEATEWKKPLVSSLVTLAIVSGMSVQSTDTTGMANLGWDHIRLLAPVFVGDTIYAETVYLNKRLSESHPNQGIVTCTTRGVKADGTLFMTCERSFLLPTRDDDVEDEAG